MHRVQWVWLVVVAALVVPHVDGDGRVEGGEEVVATWRGREESVSQAELKVQNFIDPKFIHLIFS